jgi:plasmid stabilization system protein ParE
MADIWLWNAKDRGRRHADEYIEFLKRSISELSVTYAKGRPVSALTNHRFILIKRRAKGNGHVAVYTIDDYEVTVLHVFHTAQDWQNKLAEEE